MQHNFYLIVYIILDIYPFFFLRYAPFKGKYVIPFKYIVVILSIATLIQAAGFVWINNLSGISDAQIMLYRQTWAAVFFLLSLVLIKESFFKLFYIWLMILSYNFLVLGLSKFFSVFIFSSVDKLTPISFSA